MDKKMFLARFSKLFYKLTWKPRLYRYDLSRKFPNFSQKMARKLIPEGDELICLPRNETVIDINHKLGDQQNIVLPTQVIDHFIDQSSYRVIMNFCICRDSNKCQDYPRELGCLFLGEAARGIHPDLCRPATKEEAKEHIRKCDEAGLVHLIGRAYLDCVWLGIGPHDKLFTICNCCPCCCISLAVPYMSEHLTDWFHKMPGVRIAVNDNCVGCGKCTEVCIYEGIQVINKGKATITDGCRACGRCINVCKTGAIELIIEDENYVDNTIERLAANVNVA